MAERRVKLAIVNENGVIHPQYDPYNYLHRALEIMDDAALIAERFLHKPLDQAKWHKAEVRLWEDVEMEQVEAIFAELPWLPGVRECIKLLHDADVAIALISRGFSFHVAKVAQEIGAAHVYANDLGVEDDRLTGAITFNVHEGEKGAIVDDLLEELGLSADEVIALGASWSDAAVFERVGWSAAINAFDERVEEVASVVFPDPDLTPLLPVLAERLGVPAP